MAEGASIDTPSSPAMGIIILETILSSVGIPVEGIAPIIGVDRMLDISRTSVNVAGNLAAFGVMEKLAGHRMAILIDLKDELEIEKINA